MNETGPIGNIIKILDEYRVAINLGKEHIKKNMYVYVYDKNNLVKDIDGTILGNYDFFKTKLIVTEVYDKFSICEMPQEDTSKKYYTLALSPLLEQASDKKKLNIDSSTLDEIKNVDGAIHIGDLVKIK